MQISQRVSACICGLSYNRAGKARFPIFDFHKSLGGEIVREAVVVASSRTPLAKSFRGSFNLTRPDDFAAHCIRDVVRKVPRLDPVEIEDVFMGCGFPQGSQGYNVARISSLLAGLPATTAAATINRFCSSGLQAIVCAAHEIIHEGVEVAVGGGVESITMTAASARTDQNPRLLETQPGVYMVMGNTAEVVAKRYEISREAQDAYALLSQQRMALAQRAGNLDEEIAPMQVVYGLLDKQTGQVVEIKEHQFTRDECGRPDTTLEGLAALKPYFDPTSGHGTVTAGNSSQLSDGASATLVMSRSRAESLGIKPKLLFRGYAVAGCEPDEMGIGPVFAVPKLLKRLGVKIGDIDLWELNEAFAVQVVYCRDRLGIDPDKLNVNGGSIAIGHPFGMTGSRLVGTLANELLRRKARYGVVTMCIGGGQGAAALFESCV
jgi:acetyl-CoA acyltransferase